jgi:tripartite-type tricarboxylate transporter receptor subunit TctC
MRTGLLRRREFISLVGGAATWLLAARGIAEMIVAATAIVTTSVPATAQNRPTRPVTIVYPFAAGSGGDVLGRTFVTHLSELLAQPVILENVGGAGGMTGASRVAKAAPDGYQVLLGTTSTLAVNQTFYKNQLYNVLNDFTPVALISENPIVLVARKDLPANNLQEFITYAKVNHAKMQYGSAGVGSSVHLACAWLTVTIGADIAHIPYRGGSLAMQDLIAGRIDYQCPVAELAIPQIQSNSIKAIAVLTKDRWPMLPKLASAHEQGLTDFDAGGWYAFVLPKGTPAAIVQKLHDATVATMELPVVQDRLKDFGHMLVAPERRSSEYLQTFVEREIKKWAAVIKATSAPQ